MHPTQIYSSNYGSLLELRNGELVAASDGMQNVHVIETEHAHTARAHPFPSPHGTFRSMSLMKKHPDERIACSFSSPHRIHIFAMRNGIFSRIHRIAIDFEPYSSIWLDTMQILLVFEWCRSQRVASISIELKHDRVKLLSLDNPIHVLSSCALPSMEINAPNKFILFDEITNVLKIFEVS